MATTLSQVSANSVSNRKFGAAPASSLVCWKRNKNGHENVSNIPRKHHYVPQFYLRNFAVDDRRKKIMTVMKRGDRAVWSIRTIENLGYQDDLYVHMEDGAPVSVETTINQRIETPISQSETWQKIASGRTDLLDMSDKPVLYALIRHLQSRTPHYFQTTMELAAFAANPDSEMQFTEEEREHYAQLRSDPAYAKEIFNTMSSSLEWTQEHYQNATISIWRSPIELRTSSVPVLASKISPSPYLYQSARGKTPFQLLLTLNRVTVASLVYTSFEGLFGNQEVELDVAMGINRQFAGQFSASAHVQHLITGREGLTADMTWAPYEVVSDTPNKIVFRRKPQR